MKKRRSILDDESLLFLRYKDFLEPVMDLLDVIFAESLLSQSFIESRPFFQTFVTSRTCSVLVNVFVD